MTKKTFKDTLNPAMQFISEQKTKESNKPLHDTKNKDNIPTGYKANPDLVETKSKRVQLLVQPSVVEEVKELAQRRGSSMNEVINEAIKAYLDKRG